MITDQDEDYPQLGDRRRGQVLVCHGDDVPEEFADWLEPLKTEFLVLQELSSEFDFELKADGYGSLHTVTDFCQAIGVHFTSNQWDGSLISGIYYFGWLPAGTLREARKKAKDLLRRLRPLAEEQVRAKILQDLGRIRDLDRLIAAWRLADQGTT